MAITRAAKSLAIGKLTRAGLTPRPSKTERNMKKVELGKVFLDKRASLGYTLSRVAREMTIRSGISVHPYQVKRVEEGDSAYTIDLLLKLCDYYGLSIDIK